MEKRHLVDNLPILDNIETFRKCCKGNVGTVVHWVDLVAAQYRFHLMLSQFCLFHLDEHFQVN